MPAKPPMRSQNLDRLLLGALTAGLLGVLLLPILPDLARGFLGIDYVDQHGTQWFYWFAQKTVLEGLSPLESDLFFHPWGKDVFAHTGANLLDAWAAIPFRLLLGPILGYNVFVLLSLLASALAFRRFALRVGADPFAGGLAALLVGTLPYALFEVSEGRPTQAILLLPILFLDALLRTGREPGLRAPLLAGLWLALTGYQYWYYAFFGGMVALAHGLGLLVRPVDGAGGRVRTLARHALIAGTALALVAPLAWPMMRQLDEVPGLLDVDTWSLTDTAPSIGGQMRVGLFLWEPLRGATGFYIQAPEGARVFLDRCAWTPLAWLPFLALFLLRPEGLLRRCLLPMMGTAAFIAMGPLILLGSKGLPNLAYVLLVQLFGPLQRLWWPGRAYAFLALLLVLVAATGLSFLRRRWGPWPARGAALLLVLGQAWHLHREDLLPASTWDATVPAGYRCLAQGPEGAILELPFAWTQAHLYYQTIHGRPMLGGMIEDNPLFTPTELQELRRDNSFVARVLGLGGGGIQAELEVDEADRQALLDLGYRYVVLQEDALIMRQDRGSMIDNAVRTRARRLQSELELLLGRPVYDDARVSIYAIDRDPAAQVSPCAEAPVTPDGVAVGRRPSGAGDLVDWTPETVMIDWILGSDEVEASVKEDPRSLLWGGDSRENKEGQEVAAP